MPVENPQKAGNPGKTGIVVLGIFAAVSLLVNLALSWRLWVKTRKITEQELNAALAVLEESQPEEASVIRNVLEQEHFSSNILRERLEYAERDIKEMQDRIRTYEKSSTKMELWIALLKAYMSHTLDGKDGKTFGDPDQLRRIADKDIDDFKKETPPFIYII